MPGISPQALAGYILEEMLAYLLRNAGYRLLTDERQDPHELANRHHGLIVRGRGAEHQVDVLGELLWIPAFTYPLRLVLEAKCRKGKTDIATVRNMVAALLDINQNNMPQRTAAGTPPIPRAKYAYVGAIFSASGFSSHAADFALAHAVSLVDLRATAFRSLVTAARQCATTLSAYYEAEETGSVARFVGAIRNSLRVELNTALMPDANLTPDDLGIPRRALEIAIQAAQQTDELFGLRPYMLVLKADDPAAFLRYAAERPTHPIAVGNPQSSHLALDFLTKSLVAQVSFIAISPEFFRWLTRRFLEWATRRSRVSLRENTTCRCGRTYPHRPHGHSPGGARLVPRGANMSRLSHAKNKSRMSGPRVGCPLAGE